MKASTRPVRKTAEVVIIGGGIVGASVAWHLAAEGCTDVVILEREPRQGLGSTGKATGGVRAQFSTDINIRMSVHSIRFFSQFEERVGGSCGYLPYGYLFIASTEEEMRTLRANRERQLRAGLKNVEIVTPREIASLVPPLRTDDLAGGAFCPTDGFLDPPATMEAFTRAAVDRGVRLELDAEAVAMGTKNDRVVAVETNRATIATCVVVIAAGAWAARVAALAGVELPVVPLRRQLVAVDADLDLDLAGTAPMVLEIGGGFHFRRGPWLSARTPILMGRPRAREKPGFDARFDPAEASEVLSRAAFRLPALRHAEINPTHSRAGLYEMTPDHHAILGEAPAVRGLFLAAGFSGHGVMHSPATGRILADLILHGESRHFDITPLRPGRFAEGTLNRESVVL